MANTKRSKNQLRREKAKQRKVEKVVPEPAKPIEKEEVSKQLDDKVPNSDDMSIVTSEIDDNLFEQYQNIFNRFTSHKDEEESQSSEKTLNKNETVYYSDDEDDQDLENSSSEEEEDSKSLSKRQLRLQNKVPLALLKASTKRPQNVEWNDVDSRDPYLLVQLKSLPNTIPVPSHWSAKREYLSSKRGIEKLPFELPKFIRDTGIGEMRATDERTIRQQQREKVQPRMGRLDIDYEKLYNAFFKYQTKPRIFPFGDVYEEGKESVEELQSQISRMKPGVISLALRDALGMPQDDVSIAPPWITIMKGIGKPPSYKDLVIPGLDIEYSNTGYKDKSSIDNTSQKMERWGMLSSLVESSEGESEEENEAEEDESDASGSEEEEDISMSERNIPPSTKTANVENTEIEDEASKFLYKVLKEKTSNTHGSLTGFTYDLGTNGDTQKVQQEEVHAKASEKDDEFKF
ncbi:sap145 [[Candida] subhashii]|uniref:Sap145 n=1 Tax=[Candida] subhashii TaxID=561895 RepID=A0A8J5UIN7_9ASCO|nr:sap145 [[Candida] subhashii]KAG7663798.1 sap145 [[Candida] subhashii]